MPMGIATGMIGHELSHMTACLHAGGRFFEMGWFVNLFMPGMYVFLDQENLRGLRKVRVSIAGVEWNMMLAGICLLLAVLCQKLSMFFYMAGAINVVLAATNLLPARGLDGNHAVGQILGSENALDNAEDMLADRKMRRKLHRRGLAGYMGCAAGYILVWQNRIMNPVLNLIGIAEVIELCRLLFA